MGLTNAVPAKVIVHTDARLRSIKLDQLVIDFKLTAPSRLCWAGRPAMRIVQALHWLHDILPVDTDSILKTIKTSCTIPNGVRLSVRISVKVSMRCRDGCVSW